MAGCGCMSKLSLRQIAEYFSRSYRAVDGLWFMKVEAKQGFDGALALDDEVWKVMPKIQARMIKSFLGLDNSLEALRESLETKLELEEFKYETQKTRNGFQITVTDCPWHNMMTKSGREYLAEKVGKTICTTEYTVWASEFSQSIKFELKSLKCGKSRHCVLDFVNQ